MKQIFAVLTLVAISGCYAPAPETVTTGSASIKGVASVIDGDTIDIHGARIRLNGIDAPESGQLCQDARGKDWRCGQQAALALSDRIGRQLVSCNPTDTDRYGRVMADCFAGGENLNRWMVHQGWAVAYRQYSTAYVSAEDSARTGQRGLWQGQFDMPWDWRSQRRSGVRAEATMPRLLQLAGRSYSCSPRKTCKAIGSCEEARWYLENCSWGGKLDRDNDGIPCESIC
ncbi:MAG: thermonuclease family protein [Paracoccus aminovorans]|nr:thermonuclease family protein [Paracoccus aminovorans]